MKRIATVILFSAALTVLAKYSPIGQHWGQAYADDSGDSGDDDSGDSDSGT